jgi:hypothetical protein
MEFIKVQIEGLRPGLLLKRFPDGNLEETSMVQKGEKGTPREQAESGLYKDENGIIGIPSQMIFSSMMEAGRDLKIGKRQISTKTSSLIPAGLAIEEVFLTLKTPKPWEVDSRRVVPAAGGGTVSVISYRPRFDEWSVEFTLSIDTEIFTKEIARQLIDMAGKRQGIGCYRPNRKGPFGRFVVIGWKEQKKSKTA